MTNTITKNKGQPMSMGTRRGVALAPTRDTHPTSAKREQKSPQQPHPTRLPRLSKSKSKLKAYFRDFDPGPDPARRPILASKAALTPNPPRADEARLQEIIPSLWVAFSGRPPSSIPAGGFTHIIDITYPDKAVPRNRNLHTKASRLPLVLPHSAKHKLWGRLPLALAPAQLFSAIAFIFAAAPHTLAALSEGAGSGVRVLVTVPPGRTADAMSIVGGYLALALGSKVEDVLKCIDGEEEVESVWKGEVNEQEVEQIERVIRQS